MKRRRLRRLNERAFDVHDSVSELSAGLDRQELYLTTLGVTLPSKELRRSRLRQLASNMSQTSVAALGARGGTHAGAPFDDAVTAMRERLGATAQALFPDPSSPPPAIAEVPSVASSDSGAVLLPRFAAVTAPPRLLTPPPLPVEHSAGTVGGGAAAGGGEDEGAVVGLTAGLGRDRLGSAGGGAGGDAARRRRLPSARGPVGLGAVEAMGGSLVDLRAARRRSMVRGGALLACVADTCVQVRGNMFNTSRAPIRTLDAPGWQKRPLLSDIANRFPPWGAPEEAEGAQDTGFKSRFSKRPLLHSIRDRCPKTTQQPRCAYAFSNARRFPKITKHSLPPGMEFTAFGSTSGGPSLSLESPGGGGGGGGGSGGGGGRGRGAGGDHGFGGDAIPAWPFNMDLSTLRVEFDHGTQTLLEGQRHEPWDKTLPRRRYVHFQRRLACGAPHVGCVQIRMRIHAAYAFPIAPPLRFVRIPNAAVQRERHGAQE